MNEIIRIQDELAEIDFIKKRRDLTKWEMEIETELNHELESIMSLYDKRIEQI